MRFCEEKLGGMVPKGGLEPPRVTSHAPQTCASTSSATSARFGKDVKNQFQTSYFFVGAFDGWLEALGAGEGVRVVDVGIARGTAGVAAGVGVATGACSGTPDCKTELVPVIAGKDRIKANNMNPAAAPIVIFDNSVCVPRGPNAVLETELENSAPASAFPGWSRTVTTSTMHARINSP